MYSITINYKAKDGDRVNVKNYRRGNRWETGEVLHAVAGLLSGRVSYRIMLDRLSSKGNRPFLQTGDENIEPVK